MESWISVRRNGAGAGAAELTMSGMLPLFDAGYINMGRQYLTIGVNGLVESAEFLGFEISDNEKYQGIQRGKWLNANRFHLSEKCESKDKGKGQSQACNILQWGSVYA